MLILTQNKRPGQLSKEDASIVNKNRTCYRVKNAAQEQRNIAKFQQEREREYSGIIMECHKALKHIEWEYQRHEFNFEEVEELEGDLDKIKRWFSEVKKRDFWEVPAQKEAERLTSEVETSLAAFTQTYDETSALSKGNTP